MIYDDFLAKFHSDANGKLVDENGIQAESTKESSNAIEQQLITKD